MTRPWDDLVAAAFLGTDRRPLLPPTPAPHRSGDVHNSAATAEIPETMEGGSGRALLDALAGAVVAREAGRPPRLASGLCPRPAPPEDRAPVPAGAAALLGDLLDGAPAGLLEEWVDRVIARGLRAPEECLPDLLARRRPAFVRVLGHRGAWLAAQREDWRWAAVGPGAEAAGAPPVAERWRTGRGDERRLLLAVVRHADPDAGRALLESTWTGEPAEDRAAFLDRLAVGLGQSDEPFLEAAARHDRAPQVRRAAGRLLVQRPGSAFATELGDLIDARLDRTGRQPRLRVTPIEKVPVALDAPAPKGRGPRSWWLEHVTSAAPLAAWAERTAATDPTTLIEAAAQGEDHRALVAGWAVAAARQSDEVWAWALVAHAGLEDGRQPPTSGLGVATGRRSGRAHPLAGLAGAGPRRGSSPAAAAAMVAPALSALPPATAAELVCSAVARAGLQPATVALLDALPGPWPAGLGREVLRALCRDDVALPTLRMISLRLDAADYEEFRGLFDDAGIDGLLQLLAIRHRLHQELP